MSLGKALILSLLAGLALGGAANQYRSWYYKREDRKEITGLQRRWGVGAFKPTSLSATELAAEVRRSISRCDTNSLLDSAKLDGLTTALCEMLQAFTTGDQAQYRAFHFPVDPAGHGQFDPGRMAIIRKAMESAGLSAAEGSSDEELFVRWGFHLASTPPHNLCTNCWKAANLEDARMMIEVVTPTNTISLHDIARKFEPLRATSVFDSVVTYAPSVDELRAKGEDLLFSFVRIPVRMDRGEVGVYPVFASFYWSPSFGTWIPRQLAVPSSEMPIRLWF